MSRARHMKHHKSGGEVKPDAGEDPGRDTYAGQESNVKKEAEGTRRAKHGGRLKRKDGGSVEGHKPRHHMHRGRARGGSVGSDMHPLSSAHRGKEASGHKADAGDSDSESD